MSNYYKAFIRVVKSLKGNDSALYFDREYKDTSYSYFGSQNIIEERLIIAEDKEHVKKILLEKYPQFFPNNKIYTKETKDQAQFFYVIIYELYQHEIDQVINPLKWKCAFCGHEHENTYISKPKKYEKLFGELMFCKSDDNYCLNEYKKLHYKDIEFPDDENYIKKDSPNYIYKITEKSTNKCYIGKTRNEPFFRWWNHLKHSGCPFGLYLRKTLISDWVFEVLEALPFDVKDNDILRIESEYIKKFDSIKNGFNTLISCKSVLVEPMAELPFNFNK